MGFKTLVGGVYPKAEKLWERRGSHYTGETYTYSGEVSRKALVPIRCEAGITAASDIGLFVAPIGEWTGFEKTAIVRSRATLDV